MQQLKASDFKDVIESESRSLAGLASETSEAEVKSLLCVMILDVAENLNVGKNFTGSQIAKAADLIYEDYRVYKPEFFKLFFKAFLKGEFGQMYDRVDVQSIMLSMGLFVDRFQSDVEHYRLMEQKKKINPRIAPGSYSELPAPDDRPVPMPDNVKELISKIGKPKEEIKQSGIFESFGDTPLETERKIMNGFSQDFNAAVKASIESKDGMARSELGKDFLFIEGRFIDIYEYLKYRIKLFKRNEKHNPAG